MKKTIKKRNKELIKLKDKDTKKVFQIGVTCPHCKKGMVITKTKRGTRGFHPPRIIARQMPARASMK